MSTSSRATHTSNTAAPSLRWIFKQSKRPENFWFTVYYAFSSLIVFVGVRANWRPNQITFVGFCGNILAALSFAAVAPHPLAPWLAFALFSGAHVLDCADGHLAFVADMRSEAGAWLDSSLDVVKLSLATWCLLSTVSFHAGNLPARLALLAGLAALGPLVNYGVSMCATRYKTHVDQYTHSQIATRISGASLRAKIGRIVISHLREYGNYLLLLPIVALVPQVGCGLLLAYGAANYALALNRVRVIRAAIAERA